ncbi:YbaY family lipoprotein [Aeromicrobium wangtongii]|uniref:YbaY family lipoprotein n=1 Tax=Aeromicrobium wangtongii TaxID=2969247 RepID=A0ABY5M993_9ACTN|nr:YbaY family lipoprotein [Aeromicrobium wangtongii]MCD9199328.1 YbaY family lipoprotein [Aeromicrobium wangtongii]MCL3817083.1 YbaY family lipoprotein [Aeromicrobium wangtongii]UUP13689.1 YbaY family lipoprotein [Aeromicrobium wangtongii]
MSSELLTVTGTVYFREKISLPPGAIATIKLVDGEGEVLAGTAISSVAVPTEFSLSADPAFAPDPDQLFIWAALRSEAGVWGTTELVPVTADANAVLLTKIED